jgi:putative transposase
MPFKETCAMDELLRFITAQSAGEETMASLCRRFGISCQWGYELVRRFKVEAVEGLLPRSRAPKHRKHALSKNVKEALIALRCEHPTWGPKKLRARLARQTPQIVWPAPSTIGDLLHREGLVRSSRRRRRPIPITQPFGTVMAPNDLWCIDFKGWFRTGDGQRCDPLTLSDAESRYLLACQAVRPVTAEVDAVTELAFRKYGLPHALRSDNGPPFAGNGAGGLTRLSVIWLKLGIRLERMDPGSPQQNARHERMHATLKEDTAAPPAGSIAAQQRRFDDFRDVYNNKRPHEALAQETPASRYEPSPRAYPRRIEEPHYNSGQIVRRVRSNGEIKWQGELVYLSEALIDEPVGIAETHTGDWMVSFTHVPIALINRQTGKSRNFGPARPGRTKVRLDRTSKSVNDVPGLKCQ